MKKITRRTIFLSILVSFSVSASANEPWCDDYYYGIGVDQNYEKAFKCFLEAEDEVFVILMYLNGEGTGQDTKKAYEVWNEATEGTATTITLQLLERIIKDRLANPKKVYSRVKYCDVAQTTLGITNCKMFTQKLKSQEIKNRLLKIQNELPKQAAKELGKIERQFEIMKENEGGRIYLESYDGTIRNPALLSYQEYLLDRHEKRIEKWLVLRQLKHHSAEDLVAAIKTLEETYQKMLMTYRESWRSAIEIYPENHANLEIFKKEQMDHSKNGHGAWEKYRDAWSNVLLIHTPKTWKNKPGIEISVKTTLTLNRIEELVYDPVAPSGRQHWATDSVTK